MTKTLTKKLSKLVSTSTQKSGMLSFLQEGNSVSACEFKSAGIADPRRVVRFLRADGHNIVKESVAVKGGTQDKYAFVAKKARKTSRR
jgi:hypothetical protein